MIPTKEELLAENYLLRRALRQIRFNCSYGWTDVKSECTKIYDLTQKALKD